MRETFAKLMDLLDARERRRFRLLMLGTLLMGLANMVGVASVAPFLAVLARPELVQENAVLATLHAWSGLENPATFTLWLGAGATTAYFGGIATKAAVSYGLMRFAAMRNYSISTRLMERYLGQPYIWFLGRHTAELNRTVLAEVQQTVNGVLIPFLNLVSNGVLVVFLLLLLIAVHPTIALFLGGLTGGAYAVTFLAVRGPLARLGEEQVDLLRTRFRLAQEGLGGAKEIKTLGLEATLLHRFAAMSRRLAGIVTRAGLYSLLPRHLLEGVAFGGMMTVVLGLVWLEAGDLSKILPVAGIYALAGSRISPAMQQIYQLLGKLRVGRAMLDNLHRHWSEAPPASVEAPPAAIPLRERLVLENVAFAYPNAEQGALRGLDLEIPARSSVGIVGGTGAGKTTTIDLILGLLEPSGGRLLIDGRPIETDADRRAWRRSVGYVPQQIHLVAASVAENIAFGLPPERIDMAAVERAARSAQLHEFIVEELPDGYDTEIGERGVRFSGGQRQRVGLARALFQNPDVLVFDEATSALDNVTERAVMDAVASLGGRKTVIMVAHRLSTVRDCDEIVLLEHGRVAARGPWAELIESSPAFRRMVEASGEATRAAV